MTISLCGSTNFYGEMDKIEDQLKKLGHSIYHPRETAIEFDASLEGLDTKPSHKNDMSKEGRVTKNKLIISHMLAIKKSDAIIVVNLEKNNQQNYIGGNTFLEMAFAFAFGKKIFVWNKLPEYSPYVDEMSGLLPIILEQDLKIIMNGA
jgi:hypothetical protein